MAQINTGMKNRWSGPSLKISAFRNLLLGQEQSSHTLLFFSLIYRDVGHFSRTKRTYAGV